MKGKNGNLELDRNIIWKKHMERVMNEENK